jgi:signal transduction histidine kinase
LEISVYLRAPEEDAIAANTDVLEEARELGALRYQQRASLHQVLREYQLLGGVLIAFVLEEIDRQNLSPAASETVRVIARLTQAVDVLSQSTVEAFVSLYNETIATQAERLEQFTRMASHEWRQPLGALQFGLRLLREPNVDPERLERTFDLLGRNVDHLIDLTRKLETLARVHGDGDSALVQTVSAGSVAEEAARQLREMADARGVSIRIAENLPGLTIDVGRLELIFVNLLSNAIKYSDPAKASRLVEIVSLDDPDGLCAIAVSDNGLGIPADALATIFQRFTRAHADRADVLQVDGIGLGLSIVDDCVRAVGGRIDVRSNEGEGTTFVVRLPVSSASS